MNDHRAQQAQQRRSAVVTSASGESDQHDDDDDSSLADDNEQPPLFPAPESEEAGANEFYDPQGDEYDEAFVYKHMRCGLPETVQVRNASHTSTDETDSITLANTKKLQALKPRHSDAVLSCPCCFEIVCMDCQQHDRYANQFRAMFVMNVAVHWDHVLVYDTAVQGLVRSTEHSTAGAVAAAVDVSTDDSQTSSSIQIPPESGSSDSNGKVEMIHKDATAEHYYQTVCANCQTQVAALDMTDETYHFYGVLASF
jgi:hypothetical protein